MQQEFQDCPGSQSLFLILCAQSKEAACIWGGNGAGGPPMQTLPWAPGCAPSHTRQWLHHVRPVGVGTGLQCLLTPSVSLQPSSQSSGHSGLSPLLGSPQTMDSGPLALVDVSASFTARSSLRSPSKSPTQRAKSSPGVTLLPCTHLLLLQFHSKCVLP